MNVTKVVDPTTIEKRMYEADTIDRLKCDFALGGAGIEEGDIFKLEGNLYRCTKKSKKKFKAVRVFMISHTPFARPLGWNFNTTMTITIKKLEGKKLERMRELV